MSKAFTPLEISAVILAGGHGSRMGGQNKGLLKLADVTLVEHLIKYTKRVTEQIIISSNSEQQRYQELGYSPLSDIWPDYRGPLSGIYTAMQNCHTQYIAVLPVDAPLIPTNLITLLFEQVVTQKLDACYATTPMQPHFLHAVIRVDTHKKLLSYIESGKRSAYGFYQQINADTLEFPDSDDFVNINEETDLKFAQANLKRKN